MNKNKYWDKLISLTHEKGVNSCSESDINEEDYKWILHIKKQLFSVFQFDLFRKQEAKEKLERKIDYEKVPVFHLYNSPFFKIAVVLLALVTGAFIQYLIPKNNIELSYNEIEVPNGQMSRIHLSDGSVVLLNSGTTLRYPSSFSGKNREVVLNGEAYFEIAKDESFPFMVKSGNFSVQVLGTAFNVRSYANDPDANVTLVKGKIVLSTEGNKKKTAMIPGQSATMVHGDLVKMEKVNTDFYTSWKEGSIIFREERLGDIAKKMERWYNVEIRFRDVELKDFVFSGTVIRNKPVDQVLQSLRILDNRIDFKITNRLNNRNLIEMYRRNSSSD